MERTQQHQANSTPLDGERVINRHCLVPPIALAGLVSLSLPKLLVAASLGLLLQFSTDSVQVPPQPLYLRSKIGPTGSVRR